MKKFNKYGEATLKAIELNSSKNELMDSWFFAVKDVFPNSISSQEKSCPKNAFLGMCEEGYVKGVESGSYFKSKKPNLNKKYAITAIDILKENPNLSKKELWDKVKEELSLGDKRHNSQMDVVLALWENELINKK
jgi:hypothetical protein